MKQWFNYIQWPTFIGAFFLGMVIVGLCMLFVEWRWVERFQGLIASGGALAAAAWAISVTLLHREEDMFSKDREALRNLRSMVQSEMPSDIELPKRFIDFSYLPKEVRSFLIRTAGASETSNKLNGRNAGKVNQCIGYFVRWSQICDGQGRYIEFRPHINAEEISRELYNLLEGNK